MNRRTFLKGTGILSAATLVQSVQGAGVSQDHVADGKYEMSELAGEPMLAAASETSIAVSWAVGCLATGWVEIADNPEMRAARICHSGELPLAELSEDSILVRITGLTRATRYWYRSITEEICSGHGVYCASLKRGRRHVGKIHTFMTPGATGESRFGVMNDTHAQWDSFAFVAKRFREMAFPLGLWAGDALNCTDNRKTAVEAFLYPTVPTKDYAADTPILFVPGNHETNGTFARHLDEVMPSRAIAERSLENWELKWNFAVRQGKIGIIGLDTGDALHDDDWRQCGLCHHSPYRQKQTQWLRTALARPEMQEAPFLVAVCHIPLYNSGPNKNGCEKPLDRGCASWIRECNEMWGPILDEHGVQLVICGHEHIHRWDENTGYRWKQVLGGGPECGYGVNHIPKREAFPTIIEGVVENEKLVIRVHNAWRGGVVSTRTFNPRG